MPNKKVQCCAFCKNHDIQSPKKGHLCEFKECTCLLCELTRKAQKAMRHQQRFWRHQKNRLRESVADMGMEIDPSLIDSNGKLKKGQVCDKCRNHNHLTRKKNHVCPFATCKCEYCHLTFKRREIMKHQQRVRRSNITTSTSASGEKENFEQGEEDECKSPSGDSPEPDEYNEISSPEDTLEPTNFAEGRDSKASGSLESYNGYSFCDSPEERENRSSCVSTGSSDDSLTYLPIPIGKRNSPPPLIPICDLNEPQTSPNFHSSYHERFSNYPTISGVNIGMHSSVNSQDSFVQDPRWQNYNNHNNVRASRHPISASQDYDHNIHSTYKTKFNQHPHNTITEFDGPCNNEPPELLSIDLNYDPDWESTCGYPKCPSSDAVQQSYRPIIYK